MLQLDTLSLTDMIITEVKGVSYIQLTDPNYGVIRFVYQKYNGISDIEVINVPGVPYHIENGDDGNVLIAVNKGIV